MLVLDVTFKAARIMRHDKKNLNMRNKKIVSNFGHITLSFGYKLKELSL
jgi:hypothetical protein